MRKTSQGGRRGRNRQDKLERIQAAAWTMFTERGYENATIRDIARHAGVAVGTVFLYARDKPELLLLAYNQQHEHLLRTPVPTSGRYPLDLLRQLSQLPRLYDPHRDLALRYIAEAVAFSDTPVRRETRALVTRLHRLLARVTHDAVRRGELRADTPAALTARDTLGLLVVHLVGWLPTTAPLSSVESALSASLELQARGLRTTTAPLDAPQDSR